MVSTSTLDNVVFGLVFVLRGRSLELGGPWTCVVLVGCNGASVIGAKAGTCIINYHINRLNWVISRSSVTCNVDGFSGQNQLFLERVVSRA